MTNAWTVRFFSKRNVRIKRNEYLTHNKKNDKSYITFIEYRCHQRLYNQSNKDG